MSQRKHFIAGCILFLAITVSPHAILAKGFLHTQGQDIVDEQGKKVMLRGAGLGNWLLPEGYMWKFGEVGDRPRKIEKIITDLIGDENAEKFWLQYRKDYVTESDIKRIAELGFNSVRPALNARRFMTEEENPKYIDEGFQLLDNLIQWCGKYNIYVIIDMHGAPGGQTGQNIDDSPNDQPELFMDPKFQDRLEKLWIKIAERYKNEPAVAAYDILNEPLPERTGAAPKYKNLLEPLYKRLTKAIRQVDEKHMITVEGADWANDWSVFSEPFDKNMFYQFHFYCWDRPTKLKSVKKYIDLRDTLNAPVWVGETGEKDNTIYWGTTQYFETNNIGWSFWPWKKMDAKNGIYSINKPEGWDSIVGYSRGREKPAKELAQKAFDQLLENIKLANCTFYPDVANAMLRRVPGKIEAENYGHEGQNKSYFVKDATESSQLYRTAEPVPVEAIESANRNRSEQCITLNQDDWTAYSADSTEAKECNITIRVKAVKTPAVLQLTINDQSQEINITVNDWREIKAKPAKFIQNGNQFKMFIKSGAASIDWLNIE